ncbi:MAG TPA: potassium transporter Kup [Burkholderiaceae bacterium]|nr:potassium transporter Kup [Burkholderiaceae bacterium]
MGSHQKSSTAALTLAAIGVVYGDIGTSPLYALKEVFSPAHGVTLNQANLIGVVSMILWTLTVVVSFKYVTLILRADNKGEGGIMALLALALQSVGRKHRAYPFLLFAGLAGAALFYGDGVITPAISVLSAVEGLTEATPAAKPFVVPIVIGILTGLYWMQKRGTGSIGVLFGPITTVWFVVLAVLGVWNMVIGDAGILAAINPVHAVRFALANGWIFFIALGAIVLAVTGAEALYADMGHFGRRPIRLAWFWLVFPSLALNYLGQGALLLARPADVSNPFFSMVPAWAVIPLVILATAATVIASQATISGTFSLTKQAVQLGYLPRMTITHTSSKEVGQIYIPFVNWAQYALVVLAVIGFGSSSALAAAYGIAVTGTMLATTFMTFFVIRYGWKLSLPLCIGATGVFALIDIAFFSANLIKVRDGGWFPLLLGAAVLGLMLTWNRGRNLIRKATDEEAIELKGFLKSLFLSPPHRVEGTAVYLNARAGVVPRAFMHNLLHNKVLHERNLFLSVRYEPVPWVPFSERVKVESLGNDCWAIEVRYGFKNAVEIPKAIELVAAQGIECEPMSTSYFLSRHVLVSDTCKGMPLWQEKIFAAMLRNAGDPAEYLGLPINRTIELGAQVRI